jgi:hypothetical protein
LSVALLPAYLEFAWNYRALIDNHLLYTEGYTSLTLLLMIANPLDYLTFALGNLLLVWLCALVIRGFALDVGVPR